MNRNNWIGIVIAVAALIVAVVLVVSQRDQTGGLRSELAQLQARQSALQAAQTAARNASNARLGVCWETSMDPSTGDIDAVTIDPPVKTGGVYACPSGQSFVSVVPSG
jgi:type II secretory pathway pseudopilin PulG